MSVFNYNNYRNYLTETLSLMRGQRSRLAEFIRCDPAFITRVLSGKSDLSLEQASFTNEFLKHSELESRYFHNLVGLEKSGTEQLRNHYRRELAAISELDLDLAKRLGRERKYIPENVADAYYSHWAYAMIDVLVASELCVSREELLSRIDLPYEKTHGFIDDLIFWELISECRGVLSADANHKHLANSNRSITSHHSNWRVKAIRSLDAPKRQDFHYSSVVSLSSRDAKILYKKCLEFVEEFQKKVSTSSSEEVRSLCVDFFGV